jgi:DNA-binding IclR family transcriptional regulator
MAKTPDPADHSEDGARYRAPALEKGLDVLELLMTSARPLTMTEICQQLHRSQGEMFRMVQVLIARGYLEPDPAGDGYVLTDRMFSMAMRQPPVLGLVEAALPVMRKLAMAIGQSCHLALHSRGEIVVVARVESDEQIGFSVRVGHRRSMIGSVSGAVLFGFQPDDVRVRWLAMLPTLDPPARAAFVDAADRARADGMAQAVSGYTTGVTDVSAPVLRGDRAAAALTVPFIRYANLRCPLAEVSRHLVAAARTISSGLLESDSRA